MSVTTTSFLVTLATVLFIFQSKRHREILPPSLFACWFQPGLISQPTVFSSHNKPAPARLISPESNQRTGSLHFWRCLVVNVQPSASTVSKYRSIIVSTLPPEASQDNGPRRSKRRRPRSSRVFGPQWASISCACEPAKDK